MRYLVPTIVVIICSFSCQSQNQNKIETQTEITQTQLTLPDIEWSPLSPTGNTISTSFNVPKGYQRIEQSQKNFAQYLQNLPLKEVSALVKYHNGQPKHNDDIYLSVIDLPIGTKNLHQCADAVMRLRAEYLWRKGKYEDIHFNFTNGMRVDYQKWMEGNRISIHGNQTKWVKKFPPSNSYETFWSYLEQVFMYAGTLSLSKELTKIPINEMEIGDVFIIGGSPGHAIIVVDLAIHKETKEKIFLLAQSYMPAQELQILMNPLNTDGNPWYKIPDSTLYTPQWNFTTDDLKRFM